ncbi:MAG: hypothetical protein KME13_24165, partial [Myxacorys californica WJT36-NPBG1]|nr:hypothetical protein [Myxacorys californica WJT36-NPBG1]
PPSVIGKGRIKVLFTVREEGSVSLYVGGWKKSPVKIATYAAGELNPSLDLEIDKATINNLGGDRWIASWLVLKDEMVVDCVVKTNSGGWTLKELHPNADLRSLFYTAYESGYTPSRTSPNVRNLGFGMWTTNSNELETSEPIISNIAITNRTGLHGYWYREQLQSEEYNIKRRIEPKREQIEASGKTYVLPERAEILSTVSDNTGDRYTFNVQESGAYLVNSDLSQSYGFRRNVTSQSNDAVYNDSGIYLFNKSAADLRLDSRPNLDSSIFISFSYGFFNPKTANWIGEKLYRIPLLSSSDAESEGDNFNFASVAGVLDAKFKSSQPIAIEEVEFGETDPEQTPENVFESGQNGVKPKRTFSEVVYPLKPGTDPEQTRVLSSSYHP